MCCLGLDGVMCFLGQGEVDCVFEAGCGGMFFGAVGVVVCFLGQGGVVCF